MAIRVVEIHHPALRIGDDREAAYPFYNGICHEPTYPSTGKPRSSPAPPWNEELSLAGLPTPIYCAGRHRRVTGGRARAHV